MVLWDSGVRVFAHVERGLEADFLDLGGWGVGVQDTVCCGGNVAGADESRGAVREADWYAAGI